MKTIERDVLTIISDNNILWEELRNKSILVTGGTGLIGSLFIKTLLKKQIGVNIYALVRDKEKARNMFADSIHYLIGDVRTFNPGELQVQYIIHCAAVTASKMMVDQPVETISVALDGTRNLLEYARRQKDLKAFLYLSSMEVYGITEACQNPITESKLGFVDLSNSRSKDSSDFLINSVL